MKNWIPAVTIVCLLLTPPGLARDIFVDNLSGDDSYDGLTATYDDQGSGPVRTITRALQLAGRGDRVVLAGTDVPYTESISIGGPRHGGNEVQPFVIMGNGAILDGSLPVPPTAWLGHFVDVFRFQPKRLARGQLFLDGRPLVRREFTELAEIQDLKPLEWALVKNHVYFRVEPQRLPSDYALSYTAEQVGITLYNVQNVVILDLTVQGFWLDGINAHDLADQILLSGVTARGNARSGVAVVGASRMQIRDCLLGDNLQAQLWVEAPGEVMVYRSELLSLIAPGLINDGGRVYMDEATRAGLPADQISAADDQ